MYLYIFNNCDIVFSVQIFIIHLSLLIRSEYHF